MLRYVWLANVERVLEVAHTFYTVSKFFENLDAYGMGDNSQKIDSFLYGDHLAVFLLIFKRKVQMKK